MSSHKMRVPIFDIFGFIPMEYFLRFWRLSVPGPITYLL